ncbi:hypothetical protein IQ268_24185 [Oculatella sp. LEGE 06141]|uniref:hypothetical protein n=1 Tax=Oculatella sp. LEGE 06141 TaxID=1828648 RepID=UPI0018830A9B|nr:hypothetical protein [Oculatella sp. LEGE 06141]MBE9181668.1 hypothetical protein [Oculatella sp. LEGE 06141]
MTNDVRQWLTEIKTLQQKLAEARQERDEAYASASNWRNLYETEAKQRRVEANLARQTIDALKATVQQLQAPLLDDDDSMNLSAAVQQDLAHVQTVEELKERLIKTVMECDRLTQALKIEQTNHAQTRQGLTTALGDTMDMLTHERNLRQQTNTAISKAASGSTAPPKKS